MRNERVIENSCKTIFFFRQYKRSEELRGLRVEITLYEQCGVATLESHGQMLEKMFDLCSVVSAPTSSTLAGDFLQSVHCVLVPTPKGFHYEGLEINTIPFAGVEVVPHLGGFAIFNG